MRLEHRGVGRVEVRAAGPRKVEAKVVRYGILDDYATIFDAGCFAESLRARMPTMVWAHDWSEPIGRAVDYTDSTSDLRITFEFDDFDDVPRARQAHSQLMSGTLGEWSVGFARVDGGTYEDDQGVTHFTRCTLDECSIVLRGAVPETQTLSVRRQQDSAEARRLARLLMDGEIDAHQYRAGLGLSSEIAEAEREADEALAAMAVTLAKFESERAERAEWEAALRAQQGQR